MDYKKYPHMGHFPWSKSMTVDDAKVTDLTPFTHMTDVVVMEKLDGECTSLYSDHIHARSIDSKSHVSRDYMKAMWGAIRWHIPDNMRIVGENMYAKHSIYYNKLTSYFYVFAVFQTDSDGTDWCCDWDYTKDWAVRLGFPLCPVLYRGDWDKGLVQGCLRGVSHFGDTCEGYVARNGEDFRYEDFGTNVAKYVRPNHVQTDEHWLDRPVIPNKIRK